MSGLKDRMKGMLNPNALLGILGGEEQAKQMLIPMLSGIEPKMAESLSKKGEQFEGEQFVGMLSIPVQKGDKKILAMLEVVLDNTDDENVPFKIVGVNSQSNFSQFISKSLITDNAKK